MEKKKNRKRKRNSIRIPRFFHFRLLRNSAHFLGEERCEDLSAYEDKSAEPLKG
jgi:hypothetical protein